MGRLAEWLVSLLHFSLLAPLQSRWLFNAERFQKLQKQASGLAELAQS